MPTPEEISKERDIQLDAREKRFNAKVLALQEETWALVLKEVLEQITIVADGTIEQSVSNYAKLSGFKRIERNLLAGSKAELIRWIINEIYATFRHATEYFKALLASNSLSEAKAVLKLLYAQLGLGKNGLPIRGPLYDIMNDTSDLKAIHRQVVKGISTGSSYQKFSRDLKKFVVGGAKQGIVQAAMDRSTFDLFAQTERAIDLQYADKLELDWFWYQGGLMDSSRPFCIERNRKIYHRSEVQKWASLSFVGKPDNYNPFYDCGGYNCKHKLNPITKEMAKLKGRNVEAV